MMNEEIVYLRRAREMGVPYIPRGREWAVVLEWDANYVPEMDYFERGALYDANNDLVVRRDAAGGWWIATRNGDAVERLHPTELARLHAELAQWQANRDAYHARRARNRAQFDQATALIDFAMAELERSTDDPEEYRRPVERWATKLAMKGHRMCEGRVVAADGRPVPAEQLAATLMMEIQMEESE